MSLFARIRNAFQSRVAATVARRHTLFPKIKFNSFIPVHYKRLKAYNPDIIYAHDLSTLPLASLVAREVGSKLVFDSHELETHRNPPLNWIQRKQVHSVEKKYLPRCNYVTTVCESIADVLSAEYNLPDVGIIYNAPYLNGGTSHPRWNGRAAFDLRADAGLSPNDFAIVYVGLITINRGIEFVLEAIEHLPTAIKLVAVGPGSEEKKAELIELAREKGLASRFIILDPVNPPDVFRYIRTADASIIPITPITLSYEVALPNKFFESGFSGLPIICADLVEMTKLMKEYQLGITYDALDVDKCADAILSVYKNPRRYAPSAENVRAFRKRFAWESQEPFIQDIAAQLIETGKVSKTTHGAARP